MRVKLLGPEHAEVAGTKILLAGLLVDTGRNDEALELAAHTREIYAREFGEDHWRTASAAAAEGAALASLGRREEAGKLLLAGYEVLRNNADALPWFLSSAARWRAKIT